jgi:cytochrome b6-f complex iron-sulfur subunit
MRRALGAGVGVLTVQFLAGSFAFFWPNLRGGLGAQITLGKAEDILAAQPSWATGTPFVYNKARIFFVNVPAGKSLVNGTGESVPDPGEDVLALYRKCPHLGCNVPQLCDKSQWFECLCHGSKYNIIGERRDGPAERGMDRFPVTIEDGFYVIDTRVVIKGPPDPSTEFDNRNKDDMEHCAA